MIPSSRCQLSQPDQPGQRRRPSRPATSYTTKRDTIVAAEMGRNAGTLNECGVDRLYKTDTEIAARLGVSIDLWRANAVVLEKSGLPKRDPMFARKRYWPAVRAFFDSCNGVGTRFAVDVGPIRDWEENFDDTPKRTRAEASSIN